MQEIIDNFKTNITQKYAKFDGRASRKEYGYFILVSFLLGIVANVIDFAIASVLGFSALFFLVVLALLVPSIALGVRRLHDLGITGWAYLVMLVPCVGLLFLIYLLVAPGQPQDNQYGPNPLAGSGTATQTPSA